MKLRTPTAIQWNSARSGKLHMKLHQYDQNVKYLGVFLQRLPKAIMDNGIPGGCGASHF